MRFLKLISVFVVTCLSWTAVADVKFAHEPVGKATSGQRIPITTNITGSDVRVARAYFKSAVGSRFFFVPLQEKSGSSFIGVLPAPRLGSSEVSYFLLAASTGGEIVKTDTYVINIEDDQNALSRSELRETKEIEVDLNKYEKAKELLDQLSGRPDPARQLPVGSETTVQNTTQIPGFNDYIVAVEEQPLLAEATPVTEGGGWSTRRWLLVGGGVLAAAAAADSGGGGGGGGSPSDPPTGAQIGGDLTPPNGNQAAPISVELNPIGAPSPLRVRYEGSDIGTWDGATSTDFPISRVGGRMELILTSDVTGGNFEVHFSSGGGRINTGLFNASTGDFIVALPQ
ncbi:MAG: hypothetical protein AAF541_09190 [Pseudomonadota bacterium]